MLQPTKILTCTTVVRFKIMIKSIIISNNRLSSNKWVIPFSVAARGSRSFLSLFDNHFFRSYLLTLRVPWRTFKYQKSLKTQCRVLISNKIINFFEFLFLVIRKIIIKNFFLLLLCLLPAATSSSKNCCIFCTYLPAHDDDYKKAKKPIFFLIFWLIVRYTDRLN